MMHMLFTKVKPIRHVNKVPAKLTAWAALLCLCCVNVAHAGAATFSSTNIQYLVGSNYELGDKTRSIITLEHVNAWKYGDNFFFVDITNPTRAGTATSTEFYGEISPRISLSALTGSPMSFGVVKDVLITTTAEEGQGFHNYLYGVAVDLNILPVFQINYYIRNEITANTKLGSQLTSVWLAPFNAGPLSMVFEGFADYAWGNKPSKSNLITGPRVLVDVGKAWGAPGTLQAGVEYQIWRNKFGIDGVDEDVPQLMVKWIW
jgi:nucleoside-specific outer membrane channel protein Tsx